MRCIDADELKEDFMNDLHNYMMESLRGNYHDTIRISEVIQRIEDAPTIEEEVLPLQVVTSEYMLQGYLVSDDYFVCPNCSYEFGKTEDVMKKKHLLELFLELNFCPKCGQKLMRDDNGNLCYRKDK